MRLVSFVSDALERASRWGRQGWASLPPFHLLPSLPTPYPAPSNLTKQNHHCHSAQSSEYCPGTGAACPINTFKSSKTVCRAAKPNEPCDKDDVCPGTGADCTADAINAAGTTCRDNTLTNKCDVVEKCDGQVSSGT